MPSWTEPCRKFRKRQCRRSLLLIRESRTPRAGLLRFGHGRARNSAPRVPRGRQHSGSLGSGCLSRTRGLAGSDYDGAFWCQPARFACVALLKRESLWIPTPFHRSRRARQMRTLPAHGDLRAGARRHPLANPGARPAPQSPRPPRPPISSHWPDAATPKAMARKELTHAR
jgi:hypothetical protein